MANGMPPVRAIRSASDEATPKPESHKPHTITSASDERTPKPERNALTRTHEPFPGPTAGNAPQGSRDAARGTAASGPGDRPDTAHRPGAAANGRYAQPIHAAATQTVERAGEVGGMLASNYGAACSELMSQMQGAARRQGEFMNDMLQARSPVDVMAAGNRYLVGGLQAFFEGSVRIAQAASHRAEESHQRRDRHAA
ncbi:hypothetical protein HL658_02715 [Azospirillum sp. RWY-5-1]|uniref:Phasin domain-containing protein n=1 Tax=Azospirillum oleiclasticum TaxID=2735135 RepID=A0ABX2T316_9PROT|nr:hypothetical protein [Azospirillum oleiclasticum]NYZ11448.1 hypothetical protein [Azospirillum oleiclasticum]NYZ18609.1 hypothetical protein [Azospirillum oleiclasticum]